MLEVATRSNNLVNSTNEWRQCRRFTFETANKTWWRRRRQRWTTTTNSILHIRNGLRNEWAAKNAVASVGFCLYSVWLDKFFIWALHKISRYKYWFQNIILSGCFSSIRRTKRETACKSEEWRKKACSDQIYGCFMWIDKFRNCWNGKIRQMEKTTNVSSMECFVGFFFNRIAAEIKNKRRPR